MNIFTAKIDAHGQALELLSQRQKVLAGNIANADTPMYKARDFDFSKALAEARGQATTGASMAASQGGHLGIGGDVVSTESTVPTTQLLWRTSEQPTLDGNTVDLDRERAHFADNALRYEATLRFINHDVRTMLSAITGQ